MNKHDNRLEPIRDRLWSIVARHYKNKNGDDRYELLRNKRTVNGKVIGDLIGASGDLSAMKWLMTNHNNDVKAAYNKGIDALANALK